ncbi:MAG: glucosaminidase domain-containing protein [Bacteroidales bacterium]
MKTRYFFVAILFISIISSAFSQSKMSRKQYIEKYKDIAIRKMKDHGIPASITLAQGCFESGNGNSRLARKANNHFGIKCHKGWKGRKIYQDDDSKGECFRKYKNASESFEDHSLFLTSRSRYSFLFKYKSTDYKKWAHGLKKAGYATNPKYAYRLIKIIEDNNLHQYDNTNIKIKEEKDVIEVPIYYFSANAGLYPDPSQFKQLKNPHSSRNIYMNNGTKFIIAEKNDTFQSIANEFNIYSWQIYRYNELSKKDELKVGQMVYLEKKKRKGKPKIHKVNTGETLYSISQFYAIRLSRLLKMNGKTKSSGIRENEVLKLR